MANLKIVVYFLVLITAVSMKPGKPSRRYFVEEEDPNFRRFIFAEKDNGQLELQDLSQQVITTKAALSDVTYYLFTRTNRDDPYVITDGDVSQLRKSPFKPLNGNLFISHGWNNNHKSAVNTYITSAALDNYDLNVFVVDWNGPANSNYLTAMDAVTSVGRFEGQFINDIQETYGLTGSSFILVGHSLGAHVAGNAGAVIKSKVDHIVGLDPAAPLFSLNNLDNRIDPSDGDFVQIIHTNGALLGFSSSIGHVDYFPNGGRKQPGCGLDLTGTCSHGMSYRYFAESLDSRYRYTSVLCSTYDDFEGGSCTNNRKSLMGQLNADHVEGDFFLDTGVEQPYALG